MTTIKFDPAQFDRIIEELEMSPRKMERATKAAIKETVNWVKGQSVRELSKETGLQQKFIRKRVYARAFGSSRGRISFYVKPFNLIVLNARQTKHGVTSKRMSVKSAFITHHTGKPLVFKRSGISRLPIEPVKYEINKETSDTVRKFEGGLVSGEFFRRLGQKVRWMKELK